MFNVAITVQDPTAEKQWNYVLSHFRPDNIIYMGKYNPTVRMFKAAKREMPTDVPIVLFAAQGGRYLQGDISLVDFKHPKDVTYAFGGDHEHVDPTFPHDISVFIPTDDSSTLFSWVAGAIALWSRRHG